MAAAGLFSRIIISLQGCLSLEWPPRSETKAKTKILRTLKKSGLETETNLQYHYNNSFREQNKKNYYHDVGNTETTHPISENHMCPSAAAAAAVTDLVLK